MIDAFYRQTAEIEDRHWWFVHRRALVAQLLVRHAPGPYERALDLGCGTGGNVPLLAAHAGVVVSVDRSALALALARSKDRRALLVQADAMRLGRTFAPASFDLVAAFNVLYHEWVTDVALVLRDIRRVLLPGGTLVLTEPAFPILRRRHDLVDRGARRFRLRALRHLVRDAGFDVRFASHFNVVSSVPALVGSSIDRIRGRLDGPVEADETVGELADPPRPLGPVVRAACAVERTVLTRGLRLPVGVGVVLLARSARAGESRARAR